MEPKSQNICTFCNKVFVHEKSLEKHLCEKKKRFQDKDTKYSRIAFEVYNKFVTNKLNKKKVTPTFMDFINFKFYNDFYKFSIYVIDMNILDPIKFVDYILQSNYKISHWTSNYVYEKYINEYLVKENSTDALARFLKLLFEWCEENDDEPGNFFEKLKPHIFFYYVEKGLISPWIFYSTNKINNIVGMLDGIQTEIVHGRINPKVWKTKLLLNKREHEDIKSKLRSIDL